LGTAPLRQGRVYGHIGAAEASIERDETAGMMKLIVNAETDRILGAAILGVEGGETVQVLGALMLAGYMVLKGGVFIHPTLAEGFFGLMESVEPLN